MMLYIGAKVWPKYTAVQGLVSGIEFPMSKVFMRLSQDI
jgi:hypothetical protein